MATIDHADIRGLVIAFHLSVAGLPRSQVLNQRVTMQAAILAYVDDYKLPMVVALAAIPLLLFVRVN